MTIRTSIARTSSAISAFVCAWAIPQLASASPEAHGGEHGEGGRGGVWLGDFELIGDGPTDDGKTAFIILAINFVLLLFVLERLLFRNLRSSNAEASDAIRLELQKATEARSSAEGLMREYEAKLSALETEIEEIKGEARRTAETEAELIVKEAHEQAKKIRDAAVKAGEREAARRRHELEREIVDQALARAEAAIRSSFGPADQRRLVDAWVDEVGNTNLRSTTGAVQ